MLYNDNFVFTLPDNLEEAVFLALEVVLKDNNHTTFINVREAADLVEAIYRKHGKEISLKGDVNELNKQLRNLHREVAQNIRVRRFDKLLGSTFHYDFPQADVERI